MCIRDRDGAVVDGISHLLKDLNQVLEAPEIDSRLRLVENGQLRAPGQNSGDLNSL